MSFRLKTILGIACIEMVLLLTLLFNSLAYLRESNQDELRQRATTATTLFATAARDAVLSTDLARLEELVGDILKNPGVLYVRVADRDRILAQGGDAAALARPFAEDSDFSRLNDGVFDTAVPIRAGGEDYGRVEIGLSIAAIEAVIGEARNRIAALAGLEIGLVALFSWLLGSYLTRQLRDLAKASQVVAQGDFSLQLPVRGEDELARAAQAFNGMSARLSDTYRRLQLALAEAEQRGERLQAVVDSELDGVIAIDRHGSITLFSRPAERIFGYRAEEVMGRNVSMLMPEPYRSEHDGYLRRYLATGERRIIGIGREVMGLRQDGGTFPMELSVTELLSADDHGFIGLVRDITERKRLDEQLRSSESMHGAMLESSLDAIVTIDSDGLICEFNQAATAIFGYAREETLGRPMDELLIPETYRQTHRQGLRHYLATGIGPVLGKRFETTALRRSGEEFPVELAITPIRLGGAFYFSAFLRDISARKQAEAELLQAREQAEQASRAKSQFLAVMSHEMRTPLNALLGIQELLADTVLDERQQGYLQVAKEAGGSLASLVSDILDFTKVEAGKLELENLPVEPAPLLAEVLRLLEGSAAEKGLTLASHLMPDLPAYVVGDPTRLRQVLLNLVGNAVKFTAQGGVTVRVARSPDATHGLLLFDVTDTGIGIAEDIQPRLFNLFTQADPSDTRKYGGSGLGLAIAKRLVELWGGRMGLTSRPGSGSRFWFTFGAPADDAAIPPTPAPVASGELSAGATLLLVEDGPANQVVLSAMLRQGGHAVDVAECGAEAIEAVRGKRYDLVFMDVSMPDMNGMEATRRIRRLGGQAAVVPIVAMTAHAVKGYREQCLAAGMNDYATKPIGKKDLLALVAQWAGGASARSADAAAATPAAVASALVDATAIRQVAEDAGIEDVAGLARIFLGELTQRRAAIALAAAESDLAALHHESHSLKSAAGTFGALALQTLAMEVDAGCKRGDTTAALAAAEQLLSCADATLAEVERLFGGAGDN